MIHYTHIITNNYNNMNHDESEQSKSNNDRGEIKYWSLG